MPRSSASLMHGRRTSVSSERGFQGLSFGARDRKAQQLCNRGSDIDVRDFAKLDARLYSRTPGHEARVQVRQIGIVSMTATPLRLLDERQISVGGIAED